MKRCDRCGRKLTVQEVMMIVGMDSTICGNCKDELRQEQDFIEMDRDQSEMEQRARKEAKEVANG